MGRLGNMQCLKLQAKGREKWLLLCRGVLAGNVFDWGAAKVVEMMQREGGLSFDSALDEIPDRPWLYDGFESFLSKKDTYKSAAFFVDNSGADFILGVMPFIRELASQGTKVIVVSNLFPALNDITYPEMIELIPKLAEEDTTLGKHFADRNITFTHHGQGSPCLDFRRIHSELNKLVLTEKVDLVVIEGMGRALHTNFSAKFKCDSIKVAVIKTKWLADRMGGKLFSVVFKHDLAENND